MTITADCPPPSVPQISEDTEDTSCQSRETEENLLSKSSISSEQHTQFPDKRTYSVSLRKRKVDQGTLLKRKEQQRIREERMQNRCLKKEKKIRENERKRLKKERELREAEERVKNHKKLTEQNNQSYLDYKAQWEEKKRQGLLRPDDYDFDGENEQQKEDRRKAKELWRCEIINAPAPSYSSDWIPYVYTSEEDLGTAFELKDISWRVERFAVELAQSVVGLESFTGNRNLFACSGIIVEFVNGIGYVVTSATLVRCQDENEEAEADELKINASLPSGEKLKGSVSNVDFYYNICVIKIHSPFYLPSKSFSPNIGFVNFYENYSKDVVALGRSSFKARGLRVALGKLIPRRSQFDCEELLVSTCKCSKRCIGGPLMDFDGNVIGLSFYDKKGTPFLPSFIVLKCLQHFKNFGKVIRPLHGLRAKTIHETQLTVLEEKIRYGLSGVCGVIVEKVEEGSSAERCKIEVGDIITHADGLPFSSTAELGGILLDWCGKHMLDRQKMNLTEDPNQMATELTLKFGVTKATGGKCETETRTINIDKYTPNGINRWPLPKPIIVRNYIGDRLFTEEWFTAKG